MDSSALNLYTLRECDMFLSTIGFNELKGRSVVSDMSFDGLLFCVACLSQRGDFDRPIHRSQINFHARHNAELSGRLIWEYAQIARLKNRLGPAERQFFREWVSCRGEIVFPRNKRDGHFVFRFSVLVFFHETCCSGHVVPV